MKNDIIGRLEEQAELKDILQSGRSEFVAVYGRRRVGKTFLIRHYFRSQKCIYFQAIGQQDGTMKEQLQNFPDSLSETFYDKMPLQAAANWKEAFQRLTTAIEKQDRKNKIILFFDELPWMTTPRSRLLEALEYYWNRHWVDLNHVKLFICGSSASWIIKKILYNKGGLHNRVTRQIILHPFSLKETKRYLGKTANIRNNHQVLEIYMAMGGIPFYLNGIKKNLTATQNINNLCFRKNGLLFDEFDKLFQSLFKDAPAYIELIRIIAQKRYGISRPDLEQQCTLSQKGGTLTDKLKELEDAGFILSFLPLWHKTRGIHYKVIDEFSLFYLTWIEPEKTSLLKEERESQFWKLKHKTPAWHSWSGYAFEAVCYKHLEAIRRTLDIPGSSRSSVWKAHGAQIDLLFDRDDGAITLCEIKYTNAPFILDKAHAKNLINKKEVFIKETGSDKQIFITLITANGIKNNLYTDDLISGVVTLNNLIE